MAEVRVGRDQTVWAVVVAAGTGTRYGGHKQFDLLSGRPLVEWAVEAARTVADGVVLVLPPGPVARGGESGGAAAPPRRHGADAVVPGGATRSASVRRGLSAVPDDACVVIVHDAARPLAGEALFRAVLAPLLEDPPTPSDGGARVGGVVCAVPVTDTLKRLEPDGATVAGTVDRAGLVAVQTPQAFRAEVLRRAHAAGGEATDDAALVEALGAQVRIVAGDARNVKVTTPADLAYLERLLVGER